jgi:low affinity Fe/Cu permease
MIHGPCTTARENFCQELIVPNKFKRIETDVGAVKRFRFSYFARRLAVLSGRPVTFLIAVALVLLWGVTGPLFGFSDTWQLVINTSTTIITFLMVFLIQNTQNRDTEAIQIKLDELIRATQGAHNALLNLEQLEDEELDKYLRSYSQLARAAREKLRRGELDTDSPDMKTLKKV